MSRYANRRVALIQNRIQPGGRFQVMAEMIAVLNEEGITPDVFCFRNRMKEKDISKYYSKQLLYNLKIVSPEPPLPFEWNIYWFNRKVSTYLKDYDLVINHNNSSFGLNVSVPVLTYMHFPRKYRLLSGLQDIHLPEKGRASGINAGKDLFNFMRWWYRNDRKFGVNEKLIGNSEYTLDCILKAYPTVRKDEVEILYPPVKVKIENTAVGAKNQVVSLGRIAPQKRQMEQIELAAHFPEIQFFIIGFVGNQDYYERCLSKVKALDLKNVIILADADQETLNEVLDQSRFFIHSMRNEPFGITPVQAIAKGCLPLVHNSGGQMEVVPLDEFRYHTTEEAVTRLQELLGFEEKELASKLHILQENIKSFDSENFRPKFKEILISLLR